MCQNETTRTEGSRSDRAGRRGRETTRPGTGAGREATEPPRRKKAGSSLCAPQAPADSRRNTWSARLVLAVALALPLASCDVLDVSEPDIVTPEQVEGPAGVSLSVNGLIRSFQEAYDSYIRYSSYITDEMIATGTITDRTDVDFRDVNPDNATLTNELYIPLQTARELAEGGIGRFAESMDDPDFAEVEGTLRRGVAWGNFAAGYSHVLFGELYCRAVIDPEGPAVTSDEAVSAGLEFLREAENRAAEAGLGEMATAARVGQARALLWLGRYDEAAQTVAGVSDDFAFDVEYSANSTDQSNELFLWTWGVVVTIRWTVGDGTAPERDFERWPYLDEWVERGLLRVRPEGFVADNAALPVGLQLLYTGRDSDILLASGWEARMIEAEAALRRGEPETAETIVNALLTDPEQASNPMRSINPDVPVGAFEGVDFTGDLRGDLTQLARARATGLWLSGQRQATLRRFRDDGVDLYPVRRGDDVCLPIVQRELDTNPNVSG